jgi:hypothetical protein
METQTRRLKPYPLLGEFPAPITSLVLPDSRLDLTRIESWTIHHDIFPNARKPSSIHKRGSFLLRVLRDIAEYQHAIPEDVHNGRDGIHARYDQPVLPPFSIIFDRLAFAHDRREPLRLGSFQRPVFKPIDPAKWGRIARDYRELKDRGEDK